MQDRREFLKTLAQFGMWLGVRPLIGSEERGIILPPKEGFIRYNGYSYMQKHNWALLAFLRDALDGQIPLEKNTIIHLDTHHDVCYTYGAIEIGSKFINLLREQAPRDKIIEIAEAEARITCPGDWIIKAFAAGLTNEVYWVRPRWDFRERDNAGVSYFVLEESQQGEQDLFIVHRTRAKPEKGGLNNYLTVHEISSDEILGHISNIGSFLYDVDLDYFSCSAQGAYGWVDKRYIELGEKGLLEWYIQKYGASLEINGDMMRNPTRKVYRASASEIQSEMAAIKNIANALPRDRRFSKTLSVSPNFLFPDQLEFIVKEFFR